MDPHDIVAGSGDVRRRFSEDSYGADGFGSEEEQEELVEIEEHRGGIERAEKGRSRETGAGGPFGGSTGAGGERREEEIPHAKGEVGNVEEKEEKPRGVFAKPSFMMKKKK